MDLKEFDALIHDAEIKLKRLKALYEQWFQGIERTEPQVPRKDLDRLFILLRKEKPRNTAARFRLQQLQARYNTYTTYWQRIGRRIEEGTFERHVERARRHRRVESQSSRPPPVHEIDESTAAGADEISAIVNQLEPVPSAPPKPASGQALSAFSPLAAKPGANGNGAEAPGGAKSFPKPRQSLAPNLTSDGGRARSPKRPPPPPGARKPRARVAADGAIADDALRALYDNYVDARKKNNQSVEKIGFGVLAENIRKNAAKLRKKHGDRQIDYEVVVKDGKVALKPKIR